MFVKYTPERTKDKFEDDRYGGKWRDLFRYGNGKKINNVEFGGIIPDSGNYEGEINHIEISHERTRQPNEPLTEDEKADLRSELGNRCGFPELHARARFTTHRPPRKRFLTGNFSMFQIDVGKFWEMEKTKFPKKEKKNSDTRQVFLNLREAAKGC